MSDPSDIVKFYENSTVFLTGGTGFLGKLLLEKLLRTCSGIRCIYLLIRVKKGVPVEARYKEIFEAVMFDRLKKEQPDFIRKVKLMPGDCSLPNVGLSEGDQNILKNDVNCIFHCAATVRFDQKIKAAANINVRSVMDLLAIAKEMKNLKSFIYVSTAYSHCPRNEISETFYEPSIKSTNLFKLLENTSDQMADDFTPALLGPWDNTYVLTKSIAEDVVKTEGGSLPISMIRPSIVISTYQEPVPGWIDNYYGPTGVSYAAGMGLLRSLHAVPENKADMVPADYVINAIITLGWYTWLKNQNSEKKTDDISKTKEIPIYNYVSRPENPIDWKTYQSYCLTNGFKIPSPNILWYPHLRLNRYKFVHFLFTIFLHMVPAYIVDTVAVCIGKKPMLVDGFRKIHKFCDVISKFATREWIFSNDNTQKLWTSLKPADQALFPFSMAELNWEKYFSTYMLGGRVYLFKDPLETIPAGKIKMNILRVAHYALITVLVYFGFKFIGCLSSLIF